MSLQGWVEAISLATTRSLTTGAGLGHRRVSLQLRLWLKADVRWFSPSIQLDCRLIAWGDASHNAIIIPNYDSLEKGFPIVGHGRRREGFPPDD